MSAPDTWSSFYQEEWSTLPPLFRSEGGHSLTDGQFASIADTIVGLATIGTSDVVYDLGCSIGAISYYLARTAKRVVGIDFIDDSVKHAQLHYHADNVEYRRSDIRNFAFAERVDCIIINNVIHSLDSRQDVKSMLRHCYRQLDSGGRLYLGEVPDTAKCPRFLLSGWKAMKSCAHIFLPTWFFSMASRLRDRPVRRIHWFSRASIARYCGCGRSSVVVHRDPQLLLNPDERSHFVVHKS